MFCKNTEYALAFVTSRSERLNSSPRTRSTATGCSTARLSSHDGKPFNSIGAYRQASSASCSVSRFAQFASSASAAIPARPNCHLTRNVSFSPSGRSLRSVGLSLRQAVIMVSRSRSATALLNCSSMNRRFHPEARLSRPERSTACHRFQAVFSARSTAKPTSGSRAISRQNITQLAWAFAARRSACLVRFALATSIRRNSALPSCGFKRLSMIVVRLGTSETNGLRPSSSSR